MKRASKNWGRKEVTSARRSIAAYWFSEQRQSGWAQQRQRSDREEQKEKLPNRHRERSRDLHNFIQSRSMTRSLDCSPVLPVWFQFMSSSLSFCDRARCFVLSLIRVRWPVDRMKCVFCSTSRFFSSRSPQSTEPTRRFFSIAKWNVDIEQQRRWCGKLEMKRQRTTAPMKPIFCISRKLQLILI